MMKYILYARKSSESEDRQVQSLGDQLRTLRKLAQDNALSVVDEVNEARSAKDPGSRPLFEAVLGRIERGEADGILCWNINRLSRNPIDSGRINWLLQQGVLRSIRTIDREYLPEDNVLLMAVESGVANQYILDLRKAVIRGLEGRATRGWFPCKPPQGYRVNPETKEIDTREPQFGMLRRAWELLLTGAYPVSEIRRELGNWGYSTTRSGSGRGLFAESYLYRLFDNPFYAGSFMFRGRHYEGKHKPMVTLEEFERCQRILRGESYTPSKKNEFAFTGIMRCGTCGCRITAERKLKQYRTTGREVVYEYYRCTRRRGHCSEPAVTRQFIESAISDKLRSVSVDPYFATWLLELIERDWAEEEPNDQAINGEQALKESDLENRMERLLEMRIAGEVDKDDYIRHRSQLEVKRRSLLLAAEQDLAEKRALINAIRFASSALEYFRRNDVHIKRQIATTFASEYVLTQGDLKITPHALLSRIVALEPRKTGTDKVGRSARHVKNPLEWAQGDQIRTLVADLCSFTFEELSPFTNFQLLDDNKSIT